MAHDDDSSSPGPNESPTATKPCPRCGRPMTAAQMRLAALTAMLVVLVWSAAVLTMVVLFVAARERLGFGGALSAIGDAASGLRSLDPRARAPSGSTPDLQVLVSEGLLDEVPKDAWGRDLLYFNQGGLVALVSLGRDGVPGGRGPDADIIVGVALQR